MWLSVSVSTSQVKSQIVKTHLVLFVCSLCLMSVCVDHLLYFYLVNDRTECY